MWRDRAHLLLRRWRFALQELGKGHWASVARGPPEDIVDAWQVLQAHACGVCMVCGRTASGLPSS